jgi:hypothetical protein
MDALSKGYKEVYSVVNDEYTGQQIFIKIIDGKIVRFFERDADYKTGEFGEKTKEEIQIESEEVEHNYYHVRAITEKLLNFTQNNKKGRELFGNEIIVGKRYLNVIEKYKEYIKYLEYHDLDKRKDISIDDLPF